VTQAAVDLVVRDRASAPINRTTVAANKLSVAAKGTAASLHSTSTASATLGSTLATTFAPIVALTATVGLLGRSLKVMGERESDVSALNKGLSRLSGGTKALQDLNKAADELGKQTLFSENDFRQGFVLLTSFKKIGVDSYGRVAEAAADVAHANKVDVKTSFMQLAKALQDPARNLAALNRSGIAFSETQRNMINDLMETGKTAEAHAMILRIVEGSYQDLAKAAGSGFKGKVDLLGESFNDFAETIGESLVPALEPLVVGLAGVLEQAAKIPPDVYTIIGLMVGTGGLVFAVGKIIAAVKLLNLTLSLSPWYLAATGITMLSVALYRGATAHDRFANDVLQGVKPVEEAEQKIADLTETLERYKANQEAMKGGKLHKFEGGAVDIASLGGVEGIEAEIKRLKEIVTQVKTEGALFAETDLNPLIGSVVTLGQTLASVATTIKDGIVDGLMGAIEGTKTLGEVASSVFRSIARALLNYGVSSFLGSLPGGIGKFFSGKKASGGPVGKDKSYLVGERGPEIFTPNSSGNITPNHEIGGGSNMVVNVDASGTSAEGDSDRSRQLGELIGAAVQSEIIRQQRPGGTLY
jgi:uncharacterized small protein (DUF1192 family)